MQRFLRLNFKNASIYSRQEILDCDGLKVIEMLINSNLISIQMKKVCKIFKGG
jgi:hypothetical protein